MDDCAIKMYLIEVGKKDLPSFRARPIDCLDRLSDKLWLSKKELTESKSMVNTFVVLLVGSDGNLLAISNSSCCKLLLVRAVSTDK